MPLIPNSKYQPVVFFKNGHFNTIYTSTFVKHPFPKYKRESVQTPDDDFFDIDWLQNNNRYCVLLLHGFMGCSNSSYIRNTASYFFNKGYDVCAMNYRSASGPTNNKPQTYHAGFTDDVAQLVTHIQNLNRYKHIIPIAFSLGGSILLNYLCKIYPANSTFIKCAAAVSSPLNLLEGAFLLSRLTNTPYWFYFKNRINETALLKKDQLIKAGIDLNALLKANNFFKVDNIYTTKVFGFENALDYYEKASVLPYLSNLKTPTFLLNASDDMMLGKSSYPDKLAKQHQYLFLEISTYGGHLGFYQKGGQYYNERLNWFVDKINVDKRTLSAI